MTRIKLKHRDDMRQRRYKSTPLRGRQCEQLGRVIAGAKTPSKLPEKLDSSRVGGEGKDEETVRGVATHKTNENCAMWDVLAFPAKPSRRGNGRVILGLACQRFRKQAISKGRIFPLLSMINKLLWGRWRHYVCRPFIWPVPSGTETGTNRLKQGWPALAVVSDGERRSGGRPQPCPAHVHPVHPSFLKPDWTDVEAIR